MIAQTYCGEEMAPVSTDAGDARWPVCGPEDGPCPSCLREHVAKLEAALATAEEAYAESLEARRVTEAEGGALNQLNNEIDRLRARNEELEGLIRSQPGSMTPERTAYLERSLVGWDIGKELVEEVQALQAKLEARAAAQGGGGVEEPPELTEEPVVVEDFADNGAHSQWRLVDRSTGETLWEEASRLPALKTGEVVRWIPVEESLPDDGATVGFITRCTRDPFYHGRVLGGRFNAGEFGGFSVPGLMVEASHWFQFPAIPVALRAQATTEGGAR